MEVPTVLHQEIIVEVPEVQAGPLAFYGFRILGFRVRV